MRIGILSDTHDHRKRTARAVAALVAGGAEALIHCGDLTGPEIVRECAVLPCSFVFGNNDFDQATLRAGIDEIGATCLGPGGEIELGGRRLAVTHGDSLREVRRLLSAGPDYLFYGHSHRLSDTRQGRARLINPGALHRARTWTVALLDLASDTLRFLTIE